jgi:1-acyl-sn-glycerol-3-phosphate acyltransferase
LEKAAQSIADGKRIYVFPEGTRSRDGKLQKFKKGGFHLAIKAKVPIFPAAISGTNEILPPGWINHGAGPIVVLFGKPIHTDLYTLENRDELIEQVYNEINKLKSRANSIRKELLYEEIMNKDDSD